MESEVLTLLLSNMKNDNDQIKHYVILWRN